MIAILTVGSLYLRSHPSSMVAYLLFSRGIRVFEPSYTARYAGIVLVEDFVSYSAVSEIEARLKAKGIRSKRIPDGMPNLTSTFRPPFAAHKIVVEDYTHLGYRGELSLNFLNDRLESVIFYPTDFDGYIKATEALEGKPLGRPSHNDNAWTKIGRRGVFVGSEFMEKKRQFVGWHDLRFDEEINAWIMRYS